MIKKLQIQKKFFMVISSILLTGIFSSASLPDHLDFRKYLEKYEASKEKSTELRGIANREYENLQYVINELVRLNRTKQDLEDELSNYRQSIANLRRNNRRLRNHIQVLRSDNQIKRENIQEQHNKISNISEKIKLAKIRLEKLKREKQRTFKKHKKAVNELDKLKAQVRNEASPINKKIKNLKQKVRKHNQDLKKDKQLLNTVKKEITTQEKTLERLKKRRKNELDKGRKKKITEKIKLVKKKLEDLRAKRKLLNQSISSLKEARENKNNKIVALQKKIKTIREKLKPAQQKVSGLETKLAQREQKVNSQISKMRTLSQNQNEAENKVRRLEQSIEKSRRSISRFKNKIEENRKRISFYEREIPRVELRISSLNSEIFYKEEEKERINASYSRKDLYAREAERQTHQAYEKYKEVKTAYNQAVSEAQDFGSLEGSKKGTSLGKKEGALDGSHSGRQEGGLSGKEHGLIYGYDKGRTEGKAQGRKEGYESGWNTPGKEEEGYKEGLIAGDKEALRQAKKTSYKQARKDKREELMSRELKSIEFENNSSTLASRNLAAFINHETISFEETHNSTYEGFNSTLHDDLNVSSEAPNVERICRRISQREGIHKVVPQVEDNCNFRYEEINNFCKEKFKLSLTKEFKRTYKKRYQSSKFENCVPSYESAFQDYKDTRYKEGYNETYQKAFAKGKKRGSHDIWEKGYNRGFQKGYDENIEDYKKQQYTLGLKDEENFFMNHPVLAFNQLVSDQLTAKIPGSIVAGDKFALHMSFANFGFVGTRDSDVKVELEALTNNILIPSDKRVVSIRRLPEEALCYVKNVSTFEISKNALVAQRARLKATAYLPNGKKKSQVISLSISSLLQMEIRKIVYPKKAVESTRLTLSVYLKNTSVNNPQGNVTLSLSIPPEYKKYIRLNRRQIVLSPSDFPQDKTVKSSFKISTLRASEREIPINLHISYFGSVLIQKTLYIKVINRRTFPI